MESHYPTQAKERLEWATRHVTDNYKLMALADLLRDLEEEIA